MLAKSTMLTLISLTMLQHRCMLIARLMSMSRQHPKTTYRLAIKMLEVDLTHKFVQQKDNKAKQDEHLKY